MGLSLQDAKGVSVEAQQLTWREVVQPPYSKLDVDAFTRARIIWMAGMEAEQQRFLHALARFHGELRRPLALVRRIEHLQQLQLQCLHPADQTPLETALASEHASLEVMAEIARTEPDGYIARLQRHGLLDHLDHVYRLAALYDRLEGKDANNVLQSHVDIRPGRPTSAAHRHPYDDLRRPYLRTRAAPLTRLHAYVLMAMENQTREFYASLSPTFSDPLARQLMVEIATIEEQHVSEAESLVPPSETVLEKWLLHECAEVYGYWSCLGQETDARVRAIWVKQLQLELGHLDMVRALFERVEKRDPYKVIPRELPDPLQVSAHRAFVREALVSELQVRAADTELVASEREPERSRLYREAANREGSPSELVAGSYTWRPGTELAPRAPPGGGG